MFHWKKDRVTPIPLQLAKTQLPICAGPVWCQPL
jgi:hypothetical protein